MAFRSPPAIVQRVLRFKAIQHREGGVFLWGIPCFISQLYIYVYLQRLLEEEMGARKTASILYHLGYFQAKEGMRMVSERFGYAKSMPDKKKLMEFNMGQTEMVGLGSFKCVRMDPGEGIFIFRGKSTIAGEYKRFFGIQKHPLDHILRGMGSIMAEMFTNKKCFCAETQCIAQGKQYCEFMVKPADKWDRNDPLYKTQKIDPVKSMKELGAKIEPYIISL